MYKKINTTCYNLENSHGGLAGPIFGPGGPMAGGPIPGGPIGLCPGGWNWGRGGPTLFIFETSECPS